MSSDLQELLVEQSATIASIKRVLSNFKKLGKANVTLYKTKNRLEGLETLWEKCQQLNVRLLLAASPEEQRTNGYFTAEVFFEVEDVYHEAADYLADVIGKFTRCESNAAHSVSDTSIREPSIALQLPRISLPKFSGNLTEWGNFRGIFESLVASKETLSNTQKLHYLKASVTGEAVLLINHIQITDTSYDAAWKLLVDEYDNQYAIIFAHIQAFAELPIMKTETAADLKRLQDVVASSLAALDNLGRPVDQWDDLLVFIISQKFSPRTRNEWNLLRGKTSAYPTYENIRDFMTLRIRGLTDLYKNIDSSQNKIKGSNRCSYNRASVHSVTADKCLNCPGNHRLMQCDDFKRKSVEQRIQLLRSNKCCFNCLKVGHFPNDCSSQKRCNVCRRAHHTLLHRDVNAQKTNRSDKNPPNVLLATAWVILRTVEGRKFKIRALLDQGSAVSFISESLCQTLRTKRYRARLLVHCFGEQYSGVAKAQVPLKLEPCQTQGPSLPLNAFVYQKITSYAGSRIKPLDSWPHLCGLNLADPDPFSNYPIHLLLGADIYGALLLHDVKQGPIGTPTAQLTKLGWVLSGPTGTSTQRTESVQTLNCVLDPPIDSLLRKFWEIEEISSDSPMSEEDQKCELHFKESHTRANDGRYIVRLPFKTDPPLEIGSSYEITALLYSKLEKRLDRNYDLAKQYNEFLSEYETMSHMEAVTDDDKPRFSPVYIPHHPVLRESSSTTKLRVVFNASCKTSNGSTLNDYLMTGPKLQRELASIILRWRQFRYVYTADIEKMFRQIRVHPDDTDLVRILWRSANDKPIKAYRLLTVTYGTAPAPYLAMRVLNQLALDEGHAFPKAQSIVQEFIYVDDVLFGADDVPELKESRDQLQSLMSRGGFHLRKWAANATELLDDIPAGEHELAVERKLGEDDMLKVLGLTWRPQEDSFCFQVDIPTADFNTKRTILSFIAKILIH
ncbi:uncharacterized protein LOC114945521 [Nylanderia fulva]|uniref:uncharacterized protein LOC114945521 n=1 Tax=Nylanderia fulva TaxID=613905 RepID=UPI0010FB1D0E|nr:uncharacterized protein LOC114945521 [Nylanderia fulva]